MTFAQYFRHITLFHQNEPKFRIVCDLTQTCGTMYRTFSAYKSHVYRCHQDELNAVRHQPANIHLQADDVQHQQAAEEIYFNSFQSDSDEETSGASGGHDCADFQQQIDVEWRRFEEIFKTDDGDGDDDVPSNSIMKSYVLFILQLREEFFLPKSTMNTITNFISALIERLGVLLRENARVSSLNTCSSSSASSESYDQLISLRFVEEQFRDIVQGIQAATKNEYRFAQHCRDSFGYEPPIEITTTNGNSTEEFQKSYYVPIEKTLLRILSDDHIFSRLAQHVDEERRSTRLDDDLMFSFRDGDFGTRIDDDSLLIQLYLDDIGVTNPIGAKRDSNKLTMVYFSLEDMPEEYRSKLDFIHLLAICNSKVLKVKCP